MILAWVLANRLQLVISDLIGPEQNYAVKGRSIQDNLLLVREILETLKDDTEAALINLDQSKTFDRVLGDGSGDRQISTGVPQMDLHILPQPAGSSAGKRKAFVGFYDRAVSTAGLPFVSSSLCRFGAPAA